MNAYNEQHRDEIESLHALGLLPFADPASSSFDDAVMRWQSQNGLLPDGKLGARCWAKCRELYAPASWIRKVPHGLAEIVATFGSIDASGPLLARAKSRNVMIHPRLVDEFDAAFPLAVARSGYVPASVQVYNRRRKRGGNLKRSATSGWSTHAWAIAFDVDPAKNPFVSSKAAIPATAPVAAHPAFNAVFRALGWSIGADWSTPDLMHNQCCTCY